MRTRFKAEPVDETFFDTAPIVLREAVAVARPAASVWAELTAPSPIAWARIIDDITWTSPPPFGVGTTRTVRSLRRTSVLDEYFFRWEEGRRKSFYLLRASAPLFRRFAEDYLIEPTGEGSCRFTWTIAYEPTAIGKLTAPVNDRILGSLLKDARTHYGSA